MKCFKFLWSKVSIWKSCLGWHGKLKCPTSKIKVDWKTQNSLRDSLKFKFFRSIIFCSLEGSLSNGTKFFDGEVLIYDDVTFYDVILPRENWIFVKKHYEQTGWKWIKCCALERLRGVFLLDPSRNYVDQDLWKWNTNSLASRTQSNTVDNNKPFRNYSRHLLLYAKMWSTNLPWWNSFEKYAKPMQLLRRN